MLLKVLSEKPNDAVGAFEQISSSVKSNRFAPVQIPDSVYDADLFAKHSKQIAQLHKSEADEGDESEEALPLPRSAAVADLDLHQRMWSTAGVHIGDEEDVFKLNLSLSRLAGSDESIETLRIWGKLLGREGDYFVAEGAGGSSIVDDDSKEEPEVVANAHTYWVCKYPGAPWVQLPPVRPSEILGAQQLRRFLTGNLDASVAGYPRFPGKEAELVRATIALINAECAIAPESYFLVGEDEASIGVNDEFAMPADLATTASWKIHGASFSSLGRVAPVESEDSEGNIVSSPEGYVRELLGEVNEDAWTSRTYPITLSESKSGHAILRSIKWPGAFAIANTSSWTSVYVGYGYPKLSTVFTPPMPPAVQKEIDNGILKEQDDVTEPPAVDEETKE